jgi:hypothetical protein
MKKTLFLSAFAAGTLIRFALACFLLTSIPLHSFSQHQFCGEYVKPIQADPAKGKVLYDRFGNAHSIEELKPNESIDKSLTCNSAGFFDITYVGSFTMDEQNTICEALMYISALISPANGGGNVNLEIKKASLPNGVLAVGTPYFNTASCGIQEPTITENWLVGYQTRHMMVLLRSTPNLIQIGIHFQKTHAIIQNSIFILFFCMKWGMSWVFCQGYWTMGRPVAGTTRHTIRF